MLRKLILSVAMLGFIGAAAGCSGSSNELQDKSTEVSENSHKVQVVVSFNPMREFVEAVGKDKVDIKLIVPEGTEAHDFELKPRDLENINKAHIFVYNGLGMEEWIDEALEAVNSKELIVVEASKGSELIKAEQVGDEHEDDGEEQGEYDPHIWLSLKEAKNASKNIRDALVKVDAANKEFYEKNYNDFAAELDSLYNEYYKKFEAVQDKNFVTGHSAFAYLCRDFGLKQNSVEGVLAEGEPTPQKLKELIDYAKVNNIKVIFMEEMVSPDISETLARGAGAKTEKIFTLESREDNKNYLQSMRDNLEKIYTSLK